MMQKNEKVLLGVVFLFVLAIRVALIDQKNLWFDEVFSWHISQSSFYEIVVRTTNDIHPPLYYFILKIWTFVFGDSVFVLRVLSALFMSFSVFFIYAICKKFLTVKESFFVLLLYAVSPLNLYYSQEARMSALNLFLNIGAVYYFIKLQEMHLPWRRIFRFPVFYLFIFFEAAALYTHYFSFFILVSLILYLLFHFRKQIKNAFPAASYFGFVALLYVPWVPTMIEHMKRGQAWRQKQGTIQVLQELLNYLKDLSMGLYYHYADLRFVEVLTWIMILVTIILVVLAALRKNQKTELSYNLIIGMCFAVTILLAVIISFNQKIEFYRYLSILVPYVSIITVYQFSKFNKPVITYLLIMIISVINCLGIYWHFRNDFKNDDYRQIIKQITAEYSDGDKIYVQPHYNGWIIDYTRKQEKLRIPEFVDHRYGWDVLMDSVRTQNPSRFWLVMDYSDVDTSKYPEYLGEMKSSYIQSFYKNYPMAPARVELYRFDRPN